VPALTELNPTQTDAVREIANIGAGHAATVLSQLTATPVMIDVPQVRLSALADVIPGLAGPDGTLVSVSMRMLGDLAGDTVFVLQPAAARCLSGLLLQRPVADADLSDEMVQSGLQEVGNIMVSAFFNALAGCLHLLLMPSVPHFQRGTPADLRERKVFHASHEPVLVVETAFVPQGEGADPEGLGGVLLFMPDPDSLGAMMDALPRAFGR
jgi:chemotaxis protein CheC